MRSLGGLLLLLACVGLVVLAILNPQMGDFEDFASRHLQQQLARRFEQRAESDASPLGRALAGAGISLASQYLDRVATRKSYVVASVYTVDLDGPNAHKLEWRFLGVAGRFIPLEGPQQKQQQQKSGSNGRPQP